MLIHGRLCVTQNYLMLDEVRSLLQKALRRQETDLAYRATRELIGPQKDQLPWRSIVTFMFEDHCLSHVDVLKHLYQLYKKKDKLKSIELLAKCYTCRYAACLQVVAIGDRHRPDETVWEKDIPVPTELTGLVAKKSGCISFDILIALVVKNWQEKNTKVLATLFGLVNMMEKVEKRSITKAGLNLLIDRDIKKPTLHQLVLSVLYKHTTDGYMKALTLVCFKFAAMGDVPQGLIMFTALSQLIFKDRITEKTHPDVRELGKVDWKSIPKLDSMPDWAVDKHTFRGKFGKGSEHVFLKQIKKKPFTDAEFKEFHGERPKSDIWTFFDVGCICNNDILDENPIFEETKQMYYNQKPSQRKTAKMTVLFYNEMRRCRNVVFGKQPLGDEGAESLAVPTIPTKKRKSKTDSGKVSEKRRKLVSEESGASDTPKIGTDESTSKRISASSSFSAGCKGIATVKPKVSESKRVDADDTPVSWAKWPLLQLPTGSGKVYTKLDIETESVWKGPYHSESRLNLCILYHRVMKEVFGDKHTLAIKPKGRYIIFPLLKAKDSEVHVVHRAFRDCIGKKEVPESDGVFVERSTLGLIQLHKLQLQRVTEIPLTVWAHFAFRYALNIGDTGLYNAIATSDMATIFGIDMEERRSQVKGNDVMNMLFGKLPRKEMATEILRLLRKNVEPFIDIVDAGFNFDVIDDMCEEYGVEKHGERCKRRLGLLKEALLKMVQ